MMKHALKAWREEIQIWKTLIFSPYILKPIIGLISDTFPICGYHKALKVKLGARAFRQGPYIFLATSSGILAALAISMESLWVKELFGCLFLLELCICILVLKTQRPKSPGTDDLLTEALYARSLQAQNGTMQP